MHQDDETNFWTDYRGIQPYLNTGIIQPDRMRVIDTNARTLGVSDLQLMEGAGHALATVIRRYQPSSVLILCGSGNNGGDGMVSARLLASETDVTVCYYSGQHSTPACIQQRTALNHCSVQVHQFRCREEILSLKSLFSETNLIVDALLGTGSSGVLREPLRSCVQLANGSGKPIISADIPTTGIIPSVICAFHRAKTEESEVYSIGIPILAEICTGPGDLHLVKERSNRAHKGDGGSVLIIGGGPYQGAPYLSGMAALRSGADIVRVASPVQLPFPDIIHEPVRGDHITDEDIEGLCTLCNRSDTVVCGMGLGTLSHQVITTIAPECKKAVFDADALRLPLPIAGETIYTPHAGEFTRLTGKDPGISTHERADSVRGSSIPGVTLLKGPVDIISDRKQIRFNRTGSPAMTTGGTGDILAGVCGGLLTNLPAFEAACIGAYVTGRAGEIVSNTMGYGLAAQDLLSVIPQILYKQTPEFIK